MDDPRMFPRVRIPYGTWGSSYFPAWQTSALAEVNIAQFAGEAMNRILGLKKVPRTELGYLAVGSTIPWHYKFWNGALVASLLGRRIPGSHVEQACATGLQTIVVGANEVQWGASDVVGVLTFDRTSDSPVGVFPERRSYERTQAISDVWDNFGFDPATGAAMIACAGKTARRFRIDREEVDDLTLYRYEQYFGARDSGFLDRCLVPLDVLSVQGRFLGRIDEDKGIRRLDRDSLRAMRELDTCVTAGGQTHASDGMACLLLATPEKARELSPRPEIDISFVGKVDVRAQPSMMPEAPVLAVRKLLSLTGVKLSDVKVVKNHNPFAVNDAVFAKEMDYDWKRMNNTGCPLVWGHPQGPTLTRVTIEALEETVDLGGGYTLVFGCAAGDVGIAGLFLVREGGK